MVLLSSSKEFVQRYSPFLIKASSLASFVQTYMPEKAETLVQENIYKNLIDQDEYPMTRKFSSVVLCLEF